MVLGNIHMCGNLLNTWNIKKREAYRKEIVNRRKKLNLSTIAGIPSSWKDIRSIEEKLDEALIVEERYWCQRAKVEWMNSGDRNSVFFYAKASTRKVRNRMSGLFDEIGRWIESKQEMERIISAYYSKLFTSINPR
ncbi:hypothetical protein Dsin_025936 [Dipteronia sinensis]|uniref:Uncharacterized protein n=1 Tax=Dipteronia sinensis TaxID=43782 RepID=A0AAE0DXM3_9ROSI|nr:hypothetical protein Dsin_025936 [Dipteronia sinensis]